LIPSNRPRSGEDLRVQDAVRGDDLRGRDLPAFAQAEGDQSPRSGSVSRIPLYVVRDLAPTGKLRAAINVSNIVLAQRDSAGGDPHGNHCRSARELARRLDIPIELVIFEICGPSDRKHLRRARGMSRFLRSSRCVPPRLRSRPPTSSSRAPIWVPVDSPLKTIADVDRAGVRIGVARGSAYDLYLTRTVKNATLVRYSTPSLASRGSLRTSSKRWPACDSRWRCSPRPIQCVGDGRPFPR